jgi:uncharacterized glyoxalase superfamily protein PhnB
MIAPMFHVLNVRVTVDWYVSIGFTIRDSFELDADEGWASLQYEGSLIMITGGGQPAASPRRDVDLYVYSDRVDSLYEKLRDNAGLVEPPHNTFYGMREFTIQDPNGYWLIFGQSSFEEPAGRDRS